jgi:predicted HicB family RNase H-like nuclease
MPSEKISLLLPRDVLEHVRRAAEASGETLNEFVHAALNDRLSRLTASAERRRAAAAEWAD